MIRDVDIAVKNRIWNHFVERWAVEKIGGGHGVTGPKLRYIKSFIFQDDYFWYDVVHRHGLGSEVPEVLRVRDPTTYDHCLGNFWGMLYQSLMRCGKIKA